MRSRSSGTTSARARARTTRAGRWPKRSRRSAPPDAVPKPLTARQTEVLEWVAFGKTNGEIAQIIGRTERTVHSHVHLICQKLNVPNRTAAAVKYVSPKWYEAKKRR